MCRSVTWADGFAPSRTSCRVRLPQWQCPVRMDALQFGPHGCFRGEHLRGVAPNGKAGFRIAGCWLPLLARPSGQGSARTGLSPVRSHALPSLLARSPGGVASYQGDPVLLGCDVNERPAMPQPGDIVVERLTGNRAIMIRVVSSEEMICRFGDGRFEERFAFELEPPPSPLASLLSFFVSSFLSGFRQGPAASVPERSRPAPARSRASS